MKVGVHVAKGEFSMFDGNILPDGSTVALKKTILA
jgi:hypothetical protein